MPKESMSTSIFKIYSCLSPCLLYKNSFTWSHNPLSIKILLLMKPKPLSQLTMNSVFSFTHTYMCTCLYMTIIYLYFSISRSKIISCKMGNYYNSFLYPIATRRSCNSKSILKMDLVIFVCRIVSSIKSFSLSFDK